MDMTMTALAGSPMKQEKQLPETYVRARVSRRPRDLHAGNMMNKTMSYMGNYAPMTPAAGAPQGDGALPPLKQNRRSILNTRGTERSHKGSIGGLLAIKHNRRRTALPMMMSSEAGDEVS